jgi:hypothetical protein
VRRFVGKPLLELWTFVAGSLEEDEGAHVQGQAVRVLREGGREGVRGGGREGRLAEGRP